MLPGGTDPIASGPQVYQFGDIQVDLRRHAIFRHGEAVSLEPKSFEVLRHLIAHRDRLVTKEELLDAVWKDVFVTPNVLTRAIAQLRKALGDEARDSRYIETVSKLGYRFLAPVTTGADETPSAIPVHAPPEDVLLDAGASTDRPRVSSVASARLAAAAGTIVVAVAAVMWLVGGEQPVVPASAPLIQRITVSGDVTDATISPDGRYVAYVRSAGGEQSLWVRQINSANALQLVPAAPVGYWGITFAPDGTAVYYALKGAPALVDPGGSLYRVPVLPGPPQRLLAVIDSRVSFSPDGKQLAFLRVDPDGSGSSSLMIADVDGANLHARATRRPPLFFAPEFFAAASWSPDGTRIAVPVSDRTTGEGRLIAIDVGDGSDTSILAGFGRVGDNAWLPDGSGILFSGNAPEQFGGNQGAQIWLQPYPEGPPRRVTADPAEYRNVSISSDGRSLVSVGMDPESTMWLAPLGTGDTRKLPSVRYDGLAGMAWLGGDRVIFTSHDSGEPQIWTMQLDGNERKQLTSVGWNAWPALSPDGRTVFFVSGRTRSRAIWRMDPDGRNATELMQMPELWNLSVTPDGRWIIFNAAPDAEPSTWRVPVAGGVPTLVARGLTRSAASPDGRFVAGILHEPGGSLELAVLPIEGGEPTHRFSPMPLTNSGAGHVRWTDDGRSLLFTSAERTNVWRQRLDGGPAERVTNFQDGGAFGFVESPDRRHLLVARGSNARDAFLITGF